MIASTDEPDGGPRRVALLVDFPLLLRAVRGAGPDSVPDVVRLVARATSAGSLLTARAYGAWYDADEARQAFTDGLDPVFVPPVGAAAPTATALVADGLTLLRSGAVHGLVLSGDDRLLPLVAAAVGSGIRVDLVAHCCLADGPCIRLAESAEPASSFTRTITRAERYRRQGPATARSA